MGRGWGGVESPEKLRTALTPPPPKPSPIKGEGARKRAGRPKATGPVLDTPSRVQALLAAVVAVAAAAVDLAAGEGAGGTADDRSDRAVASAGDLAAEQAAGDGADDRAGRAVVAAIAVIVV